MQAVTLKKAVFYQKVLSILFINKAKWFAKQLASEGPRFAKTKVY